MGKIFDLNLDDTENPSILALELEATYVSLGFADGGSDIGIKAAPIARFHRESDKEAFSLDFLPVDFEPALGFVIQQHEVGTVCAMNADAASACHVSGHRVTWNRLATLRVAHEQPVSALDANTASSAAHTIHQSFQPIGAWRLKTCVDFRMQIPYYVAPT